MQPDRHPRLGHTLAATGAAMSAVNGSLARFLLDDGISAADLSQLRATLDAAGLAFALAAAVTFAIYLVGFERAGVAYAFTTLAWAFGFAAVFWLVASPPWTFPFEAFAGTRNLGLGLGVVVVGTLLPFLMIVAALRHLPAARVGVVAEAVPVGGAARAAQEARP